MQTRPELQAQVVYPGGLQISHAPGPYYQQPNQFYREPAPNTFHSVNLQKMANAGFSNGSTPSTGTPAPNGLPPPPNGTQAVPQPENSPIERSKSLEDQEVKNYNLNQEINTMHDVEKQVEKLAMKKANTPPHKLFFLGFLAGWWIGIAAIFSITIAGGIPISVREEWPMLPKLLAGLFFPVAICFIVLFGGELFTGNSMYMLIGFWARRVTFGGLLYNWSMVLLSNFCGCALTVYLFGYLSKTFEKEPWLSYVQAAAEHKVHEDASVIFVRAIPANALVCTCILFGLSARDMWGKMVSMWFPVTVFAVAGYEHAIANMTYVPLGLMYGADCTFGEWVSKNLLVAIAGNIVGGGFIVGGAEFFLFEWKSNQAAALHIVEQQARAGQEALGQPQAGGGVIPSASFVRRNCSGSALEYTSVAAGAAPVMYGNRIITDDHYA